MATLQVYREVALTEKGTQKIEALITSIFKEFSSVEDVQIVIRNLVRTSILQCGPALVSQRGSERC